MATKMDILHTKIDDIIECIIQGDTYAVMAKTFDVSLGLLHEFLTKGEHSARVLAAMRQSAKSYADKAEQVLKDAEATREEIMRARELAQHYRWAASKRNPKEYGDKLDLTSDGQKIGGDLSKLTNEQLKQYVALQEIIE